MSCLRLTPEEERWRPFLLLVAAARLDRQIGPVGVDGVVLAPSRTVEDAHHEVLVVDGAAVACSCWPARTGKPCPHLLAVAVRLWSDEVGLDLAEVRLSALVPLLVGVYLRPARDVAGEPEALPERKLAG